MEIDRIRVKIERREYRFSDHAVKGMIKRNIERVEIEETVISGEIIEEYPDDKYFPSCLIYGRTKSSRHLHVQLSIPPTIVIITAYEPDESEWIDYKVRRKKE